MAAQNTNDQPQPPPFDPRIEAKLGVADQKYHRRRQRQGRRRQEHSQRQSGREPSPATGVQVGLLDADIYGPNIPIMMGVDEMPARRGRQADPSRSARRPLYEHGLSAAAGTGADSGAGQCCTRRSSSCSPTSAGTNSTTWSSICPRARVTHSCRWPRSRPLSGGLIVTMPQMVSVADARRGAAAFEQLEVPILGVIENMSGEIFGSGGCETAARELGSTLLGVIGLDADISASGDSGIPIVRGQARRAKPPARSHSLAQKTVAQLRAVSGGNQPQLKIV